MSSDRILVVFYALILIVMLYRSITYLKKNKTRGGTEDVPFTELDIQTGRARSHSRKFDRDNDAYPDMTPDGGNDDIGGPIND